jgi:NAD(P)-dependent dehydrogenase (short-subunit alcohol dehydrogenase family)
MVINVIRNAEAIRKTVNNRGARIVYHYTMWTKENIPDLSGRTVIVTGSNTGVGFETALALYEKGADVIMANRNLESSRLAIARIHQQRGRGSVEAALLDLASLDSVKRFAENFIQNHGLLHLLINNAGVMIPPASKTEEEFELQFGVNFLGHFALTGFLYPLLEKTADSRIVTVSSLAYLRGVIDFDNLRSEKSYEPMREYAQSKLADLIFSIELQRRLSAIHAQTVSIAAQPGANKTELTRYMSDEELTAGIERVGKLMDPWQGALPSLYAGISPDAVSGKLYGPDKDGGYRGYPAEAVITENALDENIAKKLWAFAEKATGVRYP